MMSGGGWRGVNGYNEDHIYKFGVCLVALNDPTRVINRPEGWKNFISRQLNLEEAAFRLISPADSIFVP